MAEEDDSHTTLGETSLATGSGKTPTDKMMSPAKTPSETESETETETEPSTPPETETNTPKETNPLDPPTNKPPDDKPPTDKPPTDKPEAPTDKPPSEIPTGTTTTTQIDGSIVHHIDFNKEHGARFKPGDADTYTPFNDWDEYTKIVGDWERELEGTFLYGRASEKLGIEEWKDIFTEVLEGDASPSREPFDPDEDEETIMNLLSFIYELGFTQPSFFGALWDEETKTLVHSPVIAPWIAAYNLVGPLFVGGPEFKKEQCAVRLQQSFRAYCAKKQAHAEIKVHGMGSPETTVAAKMGALLASFESDSEFFKEMAAVDLLAACKNTTATQLTMEFITPEMLKAWDPKDDFPTILEATRDECNLLRAVWDRQSQFSPLKGDIIYQAKQGKKQVHFKTLLKFLRKGRQLYSDFRFMNPDASLQTVQDIMFFELKLTNQEPELKAKKTKYVKAFQARRRMADNRKKKQQEAQDEAAAKEKEAAKMLAEAEALKKKLETESAKRATRSSNRLTSREKTEKELEAKEKAAEKAREEKEEALKKARLAAQGEDDADEEYKEEEEEEEEEVPQRPRKKAKRQPGPSLGELSKHGATDPLCLPPKKDSASKNKLIYNPPGATWQLAASRKHTLLEVLFAFIKEADRQGVLTLDKKELAAIKYSQQRDSKQEFAKQMLSKMKKLPSTIEEMLAIIPDIGKSSSICINGRKYIMALEMVDLEGAMDKGKPSLKKMTKAHIDASLSTWMGVASDRTRFYWTLTVLAHLIGTKQLPKLKKVIKANFTTADKEELLAMIDIITKKNKHKNKETK